MPEVRATPHDHAPWWVRAQERPKEGVLLVASVTLAHALAHALLGLPLDGGGFAALYVVPVALAGWCFGIRGGLAAALLGLPLHLALSSLAGPGIAAGLTPASLTGQAAFLAVGAVAGVVGRGSRSLRMERDRSRRLVENANVLVVGFDEEGRVSLVNGQAADLLGAARERLLGAPWPGRFAPPEGGPPLPERFQRLARERGGAAHAETPLRAAGGGERVVLWRVSEERDARGGRVLVGFGLDVTDRHRAERVLEARVRQQAAVAALGQRALEARDVRALVEEVLRTAATTLEVDAAAFMEARDEGRAFRVARAWGATSGLVGLALPADAGSQAGYTLLTRRPAVVDDFAAETRFRLPPEAAALGIVSGMSVVVGAAARPAGVLAAHATRRRAFTEEDVHFLQALAQLVAVALERERREGEARESGARFRALASTAFDGFALHERGVLVEANARFAATFGAEAPDLLGRPFPDLVDPSWRARLAEAESRGGGLLDGVECARPDGTRFLARLALTPSTIDGRPAFVAAIRDVTEERRQQERLRFQARLLDAVGQAVVATDARGRVTYWNRAAEELYGWSADEAMGRHAAALTRREPAPGASAREDAVSPAPGAASRVVAARRRDGATFWASVASTPMRDEAGRLQGEIRVEEDVTERLRLEREAVAQREAMHRNERLSALGTLVAGVAHEINNPLTYLQGNVELALLDLEETEHSLAEAGATGAPDLAQTRHALQSALGGAERISQIAKALRAVARQRPATERERVDLVGVLRNVEALVRVGVPEGVELEVETPGAPVVVEGRASELHQVLLNLLANAIDAVRARGGHVRMGLRDDGAGAAEVVVADDGPGIPPDAAARIFTPFFTTKPTGTGLGLPIAHGIVREHAGDIHVDPGPGRGASFRVTLPLVADDQGAQRPRAGGRAVM